MCTDPGPCKDREKCIEVLHLIIDGEADEDDEAYFYNHINKCLHCSMYYKLEQTIRTALRRKLKKLVAPESFINELRMKVKGSINT